MTEEIEDIHLGFFTWDRKAKIADLLQYSNLIKQEDKFVKISVGTDSIFKPLSKKRRLSTGNEWECSFFTVVSYSHNGGGRGHHIIFKEDKIYGKGKYPLFSRLWREVRMTVMLAEWLVEESNLTIIPEVHFDISPDEDYDSNQVYAAAVGFAKEKGLIALAKPLAPVASKGADKLIKQKYGKAIRKKKNFVHKGKKKKLEQLLLEF